jgi:hypothetical protein
MIKIKNLFRRYTWRKDKFGEKIYEWDTICYYYENKYYPNGFIKDEQIVRWDKDYCWFRPFLEDFDRESQSEWSENIFLKK